MMIGINTLPSNVLYKSDEFSKTCDVINNRGKADCYLIGNSNMLGVRQIVKKENTVKDFLYKLFPYKILNYSLPYSDILNSYFTIKSYIPKNSLVILETNSLLILRELQKVYDTSGYDDIKYEELISIYIEIFKILKIRNCKCILVCSLPHKKEFFNNLSKYINYLEPISSDMLDSDKYHLSLFGAERYANLIYDRISQKKWLELEKVISELTESIPQYEEIFNQLFHSRQNIAFSLLQISPIYNKYKEYLKSIAQKNKNYKKKGLICGVMNPFSLGHRYLVEYSASKVDKLYIITCNSQNFFFNSQDRYEMIKLGINGINNVELLEVSDAYASEIMFSDYIFNGIQSLKYMSFTNMNKITLGVICKTLDISIRFFGEEPNNKVANFYMDCFKEEGKKFNVDIEIIPRKQVSEQIISATYIRELYQSDRYEEVKKYVPEKVYNYLLQIRNNYIEI